MRIILYTVFFTLLISLSAEAQQYRVYFTDKGENRALLDRPERFLSAKAIHHRALRGVPVDVTDLPVSRNYQRQLSELGMKVKISSKWFNYSLVEGLKEPGLVLALPFVKEIEPVKKYRVNFAETESVESTQSLVYGQAENQITMLKGDYLHNLGFLGEGMTIAVLDGGFSDATLIPGLDSLFLNGRVLGSYNFVDKDTNVYNLGSHGTKVLSIMGGYIDGQFVGSAIHANYWLLKSEDELSETPVEMDNWLAAAEFADSVGADIITSSLGYNQFDGGIGDYNYEDMDGNTTIVTKAADMAASKGILVVVSAGNEGSGSWKKITAPADGDSVLAVGGVDGNGNYASFSSVGPTADSRIKPDVVAKGLGTAFVGPAGPLTGNGTSFSCPLVSGLAACLWQEDTLLTSHQIFEVIRSSASQPYAPDNTIGYGIANFMQASWTIGVTEVLQEKVFVEIYPNPVKNEIFVKIGGIDEGTICKTQLFNLGGQVFFEDEYIFTHNEPIRIESPEKEGVFFLSVRIGDSVHLKKIVKKL